MMEKIDVLDENGNKTGEVVTREEVHALGLWHRCVHIFITNGKGDVLLQKRSPEKETNPNKWTTSASGHLSAGDTSRLGACRELGEEIGILVPENELEYQFTVKDADEYECQGKHIIDKEIVDVYLLERQVAPENLKLQEEEVSEVKWFSHEDFKKMVLEKSPELVKHEELNLRMLEILGG